MIYLKVNNKQIAIPTDWKDLTFSQYIKYQNLKETDMIGLVSFFTGIDRKLWEQSKEIQNYYLIINNLEWISRKPKKVINCPDYIWIKEKNIKIPRHLESHTVMQYEDMRVVIQLEIKERGEFNILSYPKIIAIYLCPELFGKYDTTNYEKTIPIIEQLPYYDVVGMGNFFLTSLIGLRNGTKGNVRKLFTIGRRLMRALRGFRYGDF